MRNLLLALAVAGMVVWLFAGCTDGDFGPAMSFASVILAMMYFEAKEK
jgi:hypothetical protein